MGWRRGMESDASRGGNEGTTVMLLGKSGRLSVTRRVVLLIAYVLFIAVNVISQTGAFGLPTNADISDKYSTPITPAGWTFSIWGLIFVLQGGGVLYCLFGPGGEFGSTGTRESVNLLDFGVGVLVCVARVLHSAVTSGNDCRSGRARVHCGLCA